jgi:putative transposase
MAESFFATLEAEMLHRHRIVSQTEARPAIFRDIEGWYNPRRRHSSFGNHSPVTSEHHDRSFPALA